MRFDDGTNPLLPEHGETRFIPDATARSNGVTRISRTGAREGFVPSAHILKHLPVGLAVQRSGRLIRVNPRLLAFLGYTRDSQLVGRPVLDLIVPEDWPAALGQIQRAAFRDGEGGCERLRFAGSDGARVPLWVTLTLQADGEAPVVIATCIPADALPPQRDAGEDAAENGHAPAGRRGPATPHTLLEIAQAVDEAADTEVEAVATLHHLLESGRVKRRP